MPYEKYIWNKTSGIWELVTYPTSIIASGTFDSARIPDLATSKIIAGTEGYVLKVVSGVAVWANPGSGANNYLVSVSGSGNGNVTFVRDGLTDIVWDASHTHSFASITSKPTTLAGYGITDAASSVHTHAAADVISGTFATDRIPLLDAAKISTGVFSTERIPNLDTAKITTGTFDQSRIVNLTSDLASKAAATHKYHSFSAGQYFFDSYAQGNYFRLFTEIANFDQFRFQPISDVEYYNGSSWVSWAGGDSNIKLLLDGREETGFSLDHTHRRFRFTVQRSGAWPTTAILVLQETWTGLNHPDTTITIETWNGSSWVVKDTTTFGAGTSGNTLGMHAKVTTTVHDGIANTRVTVEMSDWTDNGSYTTIPLRRLMFLSNFNGGVIHPWTWNYDKVVTFGATPKVGSNNIILEGDARLTNARPASDVYAWAKAENKPTYTAAEVGALASTHDASAVTATKIINWDAAYSHISLTNNPHGVTKAQVGLTNVEDKSSATIRSEITSLNVTTALGFTPYNATNPSGYISGIDSSMVTTALGFTPYNATNPSGYISAVPNDHVTNARLANMAVSTIKGRVSAGTGDPEDLTVAQVQTLLGLGSAAYTASTAYRDSSWVPSWTDVTGKPSTFTPSSHPHGNITNEGAIGTTANLVIMTGASGVLGAKAAGTTSQYLRGDGTWATPPDTNTTYSLMTSTVLGLGKLFSDTVQSVAATAVSATASRTYGIQVNASGQLVVNVPWTDNNTTYSEISEAEIDSNSSSTARLITGRRFHYGLRNVQTVSTTLDLGVGATASGNTKTINIGTGGVAGSNTLINLGNSLSTVTIAGNLVFTGTATSINTTSLQVSDYIIEIAKDNTVALTGYAGLVIPKYDGTNAGAMIIDSDGEFRIGDVSYADNTITNVNSAPVLARVERTALTDGDIFTWNASTWKAEGKTLAELNIQPYDADLTAIAALGFTATAFLKKTAADTWALDTNTYLTQNDTITLSGDITGTGRTAITATIGAGKVTNAMLAGSIANDKLTNSTISGISLGSNLAALTIGAGLSGTSYNGSAAITIAHSNSITAGNTGPSANSSPGYGGTFTVPYVVYDANGHITSTVNRTITMPAAQSIPTGFTISAGATDGLFDITGTGGTNSVSYAVAPYASKQTTLQHFYLGTTNPTITTRLNLDANLYATNVYSGGNIVYTAANLPAYPTVNDGALALEISATAGATNTTITVETGTGFTANEPAGTVTYKHRIGPALTALAAFMTGAGVGFIRKNGEDTYAIDTNTYYLASNPNGYTSNPGTVTSVSAGAGMNFTTITGSGSVVMGTPSTLTDVTTNSASGTTHTHAITTYAISGTANQITVIGAGKVLGAAVTFSLPQNIHTGATPTFAELILSQGMTAGTTAAFTSPHLALVPTNTVDNTGFVGMTFGTSTSANYGFSFGAQRTTNGSGDLITRFHNSSAQGNEIMKVTAAGTIQVAEEVIAGTNVKAAGNIQIASKYKIEYNATEDSLDFVYM